MCCPGPKLTGQRGIQIWIPITRGPSYADHPGLGREAVRARSARSRRSWSAGSGRSPNATGLARLDYTQNAIGNTLVAPYSPRPAAGAPVSAPIDWDELDDPKLKPDTFTIRTILKRLATEGDPFHDVVVTRQKLPRIS